MDKGELKKMIGEFLRNRGQEETVDFIDRLKNLGFTLELTTEAKEFISDKGYDSQFGARPLHRAIQKYLEDPLAEEILKMNIKEGDAVIADLDKENQLIKFSFKEKSKKSAKSSES